MKSIKKKLSFIFDGLRKNENYKNSIEVEDLITCGFNEQGSRHSIKTEEDALLADVNYSLNQLSNNLDKMESISKSIHQLESDRISNKFPYGSNKLRKFLSGNQKQRDKGYLCASIEEPNSPNRVSFASKCSKSPNYSQHIYIERQVSIKSRSALVDKYYVDKNDTEDEIFVEEKEEVGEKKIELSEEFIDELSKHWVHEVVCSFANAMKEGKSKYELRQRAKQVIDDHIHEDNVSLISNCSFNTKEISSSTASLIGSALACKLEPKIVTIFTLRYLSSRGCNIVLDGFNIIHPNDSMFAFSLYDNGSNENTSFECIISSDEETEGVTDATGISQESGICCTCNPFCGMFLSSYDDSEDDRTIELTPISMDSSQSTLSLRSIRNPELSRKQ